ncbi:unnamed protein product [Cylindrotheca closterium]|uniref:Uncharacterized protein n=1 Tax=Cylindrotheca closterium TaxID=2856 RepID=A0AAD2FUM3_9STRA|nr:unnamed protein product [Cylindrotheca closterium]
MTETTTKARGDSDEELDHSSSQPKGTTKKVDSNAVTKAQKCEDMPFDEREVLVFSDGTSAGDFFSPSETKEEQEEESRTGPLSDASSRTTTIVAATTTIELLTTEKPNPSLDERQDEVDSSSDKTKKSKKVSISKLLQGSNKKKKTSSSKETESKSSAESKTSCISALDDAISLIREGSSETITQQQVQADPTTPPTPTHPTPTPTPTNSMDLDYEISRVREGPPISTIEHANLDLNDLEDDIFQVREGNTPKSALKQATDIAIKKVRFSFRSKKHEAPASSDDDIELNRKIDINTLVDLDDDDDEDDKHEDETTQASADPAVAAAAAAKKEGDSAQWRTEFLNDLQTNSVDYYDNTDGHSVESYDTTGTNSTDGQSITMYDCWELACV